VKVSLVTTVKDAAAEIGAFLTSLAMQTRAPDEVIVVDGGSTDGTVERLRGASGLTVLEEPGANIARGRNVAIAAATHDAIAVTDADCILGPDWLERLLEPIEAGADVAMGFYRPLEGGFLQACMAAVNLPPAEDVDPATFMPSSRSVAFRREAFEAAGGYPEWLDIGEDMYVSRRWRELGLDLRFAPGAVVRWRLRATLRDTWTQYFRYARGDAIAGMYPERHAIRFAAYAAAAYAGGTRGRLRTLATLAAAGAYARRPLRRAFDAFDDPLDRARAAVAVPALMAFVDAAKMAGYLAGLGPRDDDRRETPADRR
jgi:glycosyltransferase involved in cell wall biosynthesis